MSTFPSPPESYVILEKDDPMLDCLPCVPLVHQGTMWDQSSYCVGQSVHSNDRKNNWYALPVSAMPVSSPLTEQVGGTDPYQIRIGGVIADPYRIALAYGLDPVIAQAVKKLLRCGRKHKELDQDVREAITTLERWETIRKEDNQ